MEKQKGIKLKKICNHCGFSTSDTKNNIYNYCSKCGKPSIEWQKFINKYFGKMPLSPILGKAINQFKKCEFESAARTALIIIEEHVKKKTKLSAHGFDLFSKAFAYKTDINNKVIKKPSIKINKLITDEDRNEHEGIKLLFMGISKGVRNIIAHNAKEIHPKSCLHILSICDFLLDIIDDGSILNERFEIIRKS